MLSSKTLTVWLVGLCIAYSSGAPFANKTLVRKFSAPNKNFMFDDSAFNGTHVVSRACERDNDHERLCEITLYSLDGSDNSLTCNVTIKSSYENGTLFKFERIKLLNNDRVLFMTASHAMSVILTNMNFHDCGIKQTEFYLEKGKRLAGIIAAYEDSYDTFFTNATLCQTRICRMTFDNEGNVLKDAVPWGVGADEFRYLGDFDLQLVSPDSLDNGFTSKIPRAEKEYAFFFNKDGKVILTTGKQLVGNVAISTIGNNIGTCIDNWTHGSSESIELETLECKQYDLEGKLVKTELQANTSSIIGNGKRVYDMVRLSLPEGFLLFVVVCPENYYGFCNRAVSFFAYRFNGNGEILKTIEVNDFDQCSTPLKVSSFKNAARQPCVKFACPEYEEKQEFTIGVRCFTEKELL